MAIDECQSVYNCLSPREMLREEIRRVDFPLDFAEFHWGIFRSLLDPKGSCVYVAKLAEPDSATNANGGGGIRPHPEGNVPTKISQEGLISETGARGLDDYIKLGLATTEADDGLGESMPPVSSMISSSDTG